MNVLHNVLICTQAIFREHYTHDEPTQHGTLMVHEMCNFYLRCATSCVLTVSRVVSAQQPSFSGNMHFWVCCLSSVIYHWKISSEISVVISQQSMHWKENDQPSWKPVYGNIFLRFLKFSPHAAFFWTWYYTLSRSSFATRLPIFRSLPFSIVIKELHQWCKFRRRTYLRNVRLRTLDHQKFGTINVLNISFLLFLLWTGV